MSHTILLFSGIGLYGFGSDSDQELWETDGTVAGTFEVTPGLAANVNGLVPQYITAYNNEALFEGEDTSGAWGLWVTNGTAAGTTEIGTPRHPVIGLMTEWTKGNAKETRSADGDMGGTMRLGAYPANLKPGSRVAEVYGTTEISERHRHRYEVNTNYVEQLARQGLEVSGWSPDGKLPEIMEIPGHPWFIGVQFHPELKSRPLEPHPLFTSFIAAAVNKSRLV